MKARRRRSRYTFDERRWGARVVADLEEELGRRPTPSEVVQEAGRRARSGLAPRRAGKREEG